MSSPYQSLIERMTVAQFAETSGLTVAALVDLVAHHPTSAVNGRSAPRAGRAERRRQPRPNGPVETRTPAGRSRLEDAILACLRDHSEPMRAVEIRAEVGGTAAQVRTRLNALVARGRLGARGQSSGRRYFPARTSTRARARGK